MGGRRLDVGARRIMLIADSPKDDYILIGPLLGALSEAGALAELFTDGSAGLQSAGRERVDLVVVDLDTPSLGGLDALIGIGRLASRIPVLLVTAEDSKARRMWAVEMGAIGYVTKRVDGRLLARYITKVLEAG